MLILLQHVREQLARLKHASWKVRVVTEPHLGVELLIFDFKVGAWRPCAQLSGQRLLPFLAPGIIIAGAAELEDSLSCHCESRVSEVGKLKEDQANSGRGRRMKKIV